jgi:hypothetical protein
MVPMADNKVLNEDPRFEETFDFTAGTLAGL